MERIFGPVRKEGSGRGKKGKEREREKEREEEERRVEFRQCSANGKLEQCLLNQEGHPIVRMALHQKVS